MRALLCSLAGTTAAVGTVRVVGNKARLFKNGHPLVFGGAVSGVKNEPKAGGVVDVVDGLGELIGWGVWNPHSMYRVRMLAHESEIDMLEHRDLDALVRSRLAAAWERRAACGLPSERTTAFRLVNSEGDRISGLTVDVFGSTAVAVSSALWLEQRQTAVTSALLGLEGIDEVVWRRSDGRLKQDGWEPPPKAAAAADNAAASATAPRPPPARPPPVEIVENGLRYLVSPTLGQKSGFYCDQRDNRAWLAELCGGKRVLDLFCYSGGFSLAAASAGALACQGVDSSAAAVELAEANAALNGVAPTCRFTKSDVPAFLKEPSLASTYDVVICDPPKLAPSVKDLPRATAAPTRIRRAPAAACPCSDRPTARVRQAPPASTSRSIASRSARSSPAA